MFRKLLFLTSLLPLVACSQPRPTSTPRAGLFSTPTPTIESRNSLCGVNNPVVPFQEPDPDGQTTYTFNSTNFGLQYGVISALKMTKQGLLIGYASNSVDSYGVTVLYKTAWEACKYGQAP